ncbi:MAG: hypothetical protein EOO75_17415, partial [Myxococcales bacterium]
MLDALLDLGPDPHRDGELLAAIAAHTAAAEASRRGSDGGLIGRAEAAVRADPQAFEVDPDGHATLAVDGHRWAAGRFAPVAVGELRRRAGRRQAAAGADRGRLRLWVLDGASVAGDIGTLQATGGEGALFQVASQFNCLESPGPCVVPVRDYVHDYTQGPRASVGAFPATLWRHHRAPAPHGGTFEQVTDGPQLDLLDGVGDPSVGRPFNGYLTAEHVPDAGAFLEALRASADAIKVGLHEGAEVALGADWFGEVTGRPRITQVFTSTVAGGGYGGERFGEHFAPICAELLRAAYTGTLLAAVATGQRKAVLTLIGGGVFGNPMPLIWRAIEDALADVAPLLAGDLDVVVNGRDLSRRLPVETMVASARRWEGALV